MKSLYIHYKNKYPGGRVDQSDAGLDVYDSEGRHCVSMRKNGAGQMVDVSAEYGCEHTHDLSPIPKDARLWKQCLKTGNVIKDEKHAERSAKVKDFLSEDGKVLSCYDLGGQYKFDDRQVVLEKLK